MGYVMKKFITARFLLASILIAGLLGGCAGTTPAPWTPVPTDDPATVVAAAVATLGMKMTEEALRNPTATLEPSATPEPTKTPLPPTPEPTVAEVSPTPAPPTATTAPALSAQVLYMTTYPENRRDYVPNERFSLAIGVRNTGTITWEPGMKVKVVKIEGEITVAPEAVFNSEVAPGGKAEFDLWAFGSEMLGEHAWHFQVYTKDDIAVPGGYTVFRYESH
jgi:hypothetical protein